jgi:hypothetical protein
MDRRPRRSENRSATGLGTLVVLWAETRCEYRSRNKGDIEMDEQAAKKLAEEIVEAENAGREGGREKADLLLSPRFIKITRARIPPGRNQEQTRKEWLDTIGAAEKDSPHRIVQFDEQPGAWLVGSACWVVRGVVTTNNERFRNTWIFRLDDAKWRLFALQVTQLI